MIEEMKDRIRQIMEAQHMTQQVFADFIGMAPATLSSIFNGRTRPTLNVVEAIKKKIPDISIDWLMFGTGGMYSSAIPSPDGASEGVFPPQEPTLNFDAPSAPAPQPSGFTAPNSNSVKSTRPEIVREEIKFVDKPQRRIMEIRVFYDDQTWDSFIPAKK